MIDLFGLMMLAVHIEQHPRPDLAQLQINMESLDPMGLDQEKIQPGLGAMTLDGMNEEIIRIQLMRHDQVVNALHRTNYSGSNSPCQSSFAGA